MATQHNYDMEGSTSRGGSPQTMLQTQQQHSHDGQMKARDAHEQHNRPGQLARRDIHPESGLVQRQPQDVQHERAQDQDVAPRHHESDRGGAPAVRLDMDLDVDVELKAKIKGDLTLAILESDRNQKQGDTR